MKKVLSLSFLLVALFIGVQASDPPKKKSTNVSTSIAGQVIDESTGEALAGATVTIEGMDLNVYTDFDGQFQFDELSPGEYTIKLNLISYDDNTSKITADLKKDNTLKIKLKRTR